MFTYKLTCPHCEAKHVEHRPTPYGKNIRRKICPDCKRQRQLEINNGVLLAKSGYDENAKERCGFCIHWGAETDEPTNEWYRACGRGRISDVSHEKGQHQVYALDSCDDFVFDEEFAELLAILNGDRVE